MYIQPKPKSDQVSWLNKIRKGRPFVLRPLPDEILGKNTYDFDLIFGHGIWTKGLFWFRFNNRKGFHIKNTKIHELIFSERMNIKGSGFSIGNWHFKWLKRYEA